MLMHCTRVSLELICILIPSEGSTQRLQKTAKKKQLTEVNWCTNISGYKSDIVINNCVSFCLSWVIFHRWPPSHSLGGLTQRADVGAEVSHSAASVSHHSGGLREQLAGRKYHVSFFISSFFTSWGTSAAVIMLSGSSAFSLFSNT